MDWIRTGFLLAAVFLSTAYCQSTPTILQDIQKEVKKIGQTGFLNCSVKTPNSAQNLGVHVKWSRNDGSSSKHLTDNDRVVDDFNPSVEGGLKKYGVLNVRPHGKDYIDYVLIVRQLTVDDGKNYTCRVSWQGDVKGVKRIGILDVQVPPKVFEMSSPGAVVNQFDSVSLFCYANGNPMPTISWSYGSANTLPVGHKIESRLVNVDGIPLVKSTLKLTNITKRDKGLYRCEADNTVPPVYKYEMTLAVQYACIISNVLSAYDAVLSKPAKVECKGTGNPDPDVNWYYLGKFSGREQDLPTDVNKVMSLKELTQGADYYVEEFHESHLTVPDESGKQEKAWLFRLVIATFEARHIGHYACVATNTLGSTFATAEIYQTDCNRGDCGLNPSGAALTSPAPVLLICLSLLTLVKALCSS